MAHSHSNTNWKLVVFDRLRLYWRFGFEFWPILKIQRSDRHLWFQLLTRLIQEDYNSDFRHKAPHTLHILKEKQKERKWLLRNHNKNVSQSQRLSPSWKKSNNVLPSQIKKLKPTALNDLEDTHVGTSLKTLPLSYSRK